MITIQFGMKEALEVGDVYITSNGRKLIVSNVEGTLVFFKQYRWYHKLKYWVKTFWIRRELKELNKI